MLKREKYRERWGRGEGGGGEEDEIGLGVCTVFPREE